MRILRYLLPVFFSITLIPALSQKQVSANPLLIHSNKPIAFDKVNAIVIRDAVGQVIKVTDGRVKMIVSGLKPGAGPGSTLAAYDEMTYELNDLAMKLGLVAQTYPSDSVRDAAN